MSETHYDAFIADPAPERRMRLRQAMAAVPRFGKVTLFPTLEELYERMKEEPAGVLFMSQSFGSQEVEDFVKLAKSGPNGTAAAYIMVMGSDIKDPSMVAQTMLAGTDGFLLEPYSVESLASITEIAALVRGDREKTREDKALKLLLKGVSKQLRAIATLKASGQDVAKHLQRLRDKCSLIYQLPPEAHENYLKIACEVFEQGIPLRQDVHMKVLLGPGTRVKARARERLAKALEKELDPNNVGEIIT